jgi:hypothetical protein
MRLNGLLGARVGKMGEAGYAACAIRTQRSLVGLLVLHEKRVNEPGAGKRVLHFGAGQAKLELREALPALWLQPD